MNPKEQQFLDLVEANKDRLMRICRIYGEDRQDQEDLFQEILVNAWQSLDGFAGRSQVHTWLYRVALNVALRHRSRNRKKSVPAPSWLHYRPSVAEDLEKKEQIDRLYRAIGSLGETDRKLVLLHLDELSYREISEVTGLSESNVGVRLNRARKKLLQLLAPKVTRK